MKIESQLSRIIKLEINNKEDEIRNRKIHDIFLRAFATYQ